MAARSIGSATISFGLVSIPVRLYAATRPSAGVGFNLLHRKCGSRLRQQYVCPADGEIVPRDQAAKGYEFAKDRYVVFTDEEIEAVEEPPSRAIDITEFLPLAQIDPVYFEKAYYLGPDKGGAKAYRLLHDALRETGRAAVARFAARGKQYLTLVRPAGDRLILQQLFYADEVRPLDEVPIDPAQIRPGELELAEKLIEQGTAEAFHPEAYHDDVRDRVRAAVERKVAGEEIEIPPTEAPGGQIVDLVEALKKSVAGRAKEETHRTPARKPRRAPSRPHPHKPAPAHAKA